MIEVVNFHYIRDFGLPGDIRCDRQTKWGNPFIMYYQSQRDAVCDNYEKYLDAITKEDNVDEVRKILSEGGLNQIQVDIWIKRTGGFLDISEIAHARRIFCYCKPLRCHCDTLARKLMELNRGPVKEDDWNFFGDDKECQTNAT
jgi:hypothetical protein